MILFLYFFIFIFGLLIGSFLNCMVYRLETSESFVGGRSYCPKCKHKLSWTDLLPLFSFLLLCAKCRYCKAKISWQYPLVEISTALIFLLIFNLLTGQVGFQFSIFNLHFLLDISYLFLTASILVAIFVYDLKHFIIPDKLIFLAIIASVIWLLISKLLLSYNVSALLNNFYAALVASGFFLLIVLISKGKWMGVGDIKLAFFMGLLLGIPNILLALFLAFWSGSIIGIIMIVMNKKKMKSEIPFAPFLISGTFVSLFLGNNIINWYSMFL